MPVGMRHGSAGGQFDIAFASIFASDIILLLRGYASLAGSDALGTVHTIPITTFTPSQPNVPSEHIL